jgi:hypothetical protein
METEHLTVAYYDEDNIWPSILPYINAQLPLTDVNFRQISSMEDVADSFSGYINGVQNFIKLPKIFPKFIKHENAFWGESFEDAFRKPYFWIYVLNYTNYETFKTKSKPKILEIVNRMMEQRIEWLILFLHPLSTTNKTSHKSYNRAYDKVSLDIYSMVGVKQCFKLYCPDAKMFLCTDQSLDSCKSYMEEFVKAMGRGISNGLFNRLTFFLEEINKIEETKDYNLYILMKEGLAITYSIAGLKKDAKKLYDEILSPPEIYLPINFGEITLEELKNTSEITMEEYRSNNKALSHLYLRKYIFNCQKKLLESDEDFIEIGRLCLSFICTCLGLFKSIGETDEKYLGSIWVYNHSLALAKYLQEKSETIDDPDVSGVVHYSVGLMLSLVRSRLQILSRMKFNSYEIQMDLEAANDFSLDRSPVKIEGRALKPKSLEEEIVVENLNNSDLSLEAVLETQYRLEEALMILTYSLHEHFFRANYLKFSQRYKVEQGILLTSRGMFDQASEILSSINDTEWDALQAVILVNLLQCFLNSYNKFNEAVKVAIKICKLSKILPSTTITKLWKCIEDLSYITETQSLEANDLFEPVLSIKANNILQGDMLEVTCTVNCKIPCNVTFNKISCQFFSTKENGSLVLECQNITLDPGLNTLKLSGVASSQGKMKSTELVFNMNKLDLNVKVAFPQIVIEENTKCVSLIHKVPSLLVYNEIQLLAIEISTRLYSIDSGFIKFPRETKVIYN